MKKQLRVFRLFLALAVVLLAGFSPAQAATDQPKAALLKISPENTVAACNEVTITVRVENVTALYAYSLVINFPPGSLEILEVSNAGFLQDGMFPPTNGFDNTLGIIQFDMTQMSPALPVDGSGDLIRIRLRPTSTQAAVPITISTDSILVNWPDVAPIEYTITNGVVQTAQHCLYLPSIRK